MFLAEDMIHLTAISRFFLMNAAILATIRGSLTHLSP